MVACLSHLLRVVVASALADPANRSLCLRHLDLDLDRDRDAYLLYRLAVALLSCRRSEDEYLPMTELPSRS